MYEVKILYICIFRSETRMPSGFPAIRAVYGGVYFVYFVYGSRKACRGADRRVSHFVYNWLGLSSLVDVWVCKFI